MVILSKSLSFVLIAQTLLISCESQNPNSHGSPPNDGTQESEDFNEQETNPEHSDIQTRDEELPTNDAAAKESVKAQLLSELERLELKQALVDEFSDELTYAAVDSQFRYMPSAFLGFYASMILATESASRESLFGFQSTESFERVLARRFENKLMEKINKIAREQGKTFADEFRKSTEFSEISHEVWDRARFKYYLPYHQNRLQLAETNFLEANRLSSGRVGEKELERLNQIKPLEEAFNQANTAARNDAVHEMDKWIQLKSRSHERKIAHKLAKEQHVELRSKLKAATWRRLSTGGLSIGVALLTFKSLEYLVINQKDHETLRLEVSRKKSEIYEQISGIRSVAQSLDITIDEELTPELVEKIRAALANQ